MKWNITANLLDGYVPMAGLNQAPPQILSVEEFDTPSPYVRVSGRFGEGTDPTFSIYLPPKEKWEGRFIQRVHPYLDLSISENYEFYADSGAYSLSVPQGTMGHIVHASAAYVSRTIARNYYDYNDKIYGYVYGGSGGSMITFGTLELDTGLVWDGAVPYITASPASMGNFDIKWFARAVLEGKAPLIADAVRPGGSGDPYAVLTDMEREVLIEVTKLGIPLKAWENYEYMFMLMDYPELIDALNSTAAEEATYANSSVNDAYTSAFWNKPGHLEAYDPELRKLFYSLRDRGVREAALAKIAYHRHKDPGPTFTTWDHLRDESGKPLFAQTTGSHYAIDISKMVSGGATWNGNINRKTIMLVMLLDLDSFPSDGNYYKERVHLAGRDSDYRIWLNENADHHPKRDEHTLYLNGRLIDYTGIFEQALRDLIAWVERGVEPPASSSYIVTSDNQLIAQSDITLRGGIQPVVELTANGSTCAIILSGGAVLFSADIQVPPGTGKIVSVEWDFLGDGNYAAADYEALPDGSWSVNASYTYDMAGTYFPQIRVTSQREGDPDTPFTRVHNIGRARVLAT